MYVYRALDNAGNIVSGRLPAITPLELETRLQGSGLELLKARKSRRALFFKGRPPQRELINFCLHMEATLHAGLMVTEALEDLTDNVENRQFRDVLSVVLQAVSDGSSLSDALSPFPNVFGEIFVGMVRSGEESGNLADAFANLGATLRWQDELSTQMKRMIMYPAFVSIVIGAVTLFVLLYLVPQLGSFFNSLTNDGPLPLPTRGLLFLSESLQNYWLTMILSLIGAVLLLYLIIRTGGAVARKQVDALKLKIPIIGPIAKKVMLARFCSLLGMLYASGVPVMRSMTVARDAIGNSAIAGGVDQAIELIEQGKGITEAFAASKLFPNLMLRMIKVGETTGEVDKGLKNVTYFFNRDIQEAIGRLQAMIEPALTIALGMILLTLMVSVLGPIYDILGKVKV
jgi:type IV pilus assembly protein PilC